MSNKFSSRKFHATSRTFYCVVEKFCLSYNNFIHRLACCRNYHTDRRKFRLDVFIFYFFRHDLTERDRDMAREVKVFIGWSFLYEWNLERSRSSETNDRTPGVYHIVLFIRRLSCSSFYKHRVINIARLRRLNCRRKRRLRLFLQMRQFVCNSVKLSRKLLLSTSFNKKKYQTIN